MYVLKSRREVFEKFVEWKALVERQSEHKIKVFRSDNGGEYTSKRFDEYIHGIEGTHQPPTPHNKMGWPNVQTAPLWRWQGP